ncbi:SUMF1/EgtB/PvdO family nonheme iron enzyme [Streptomyces decoyicus]|uniref:SUMF1/EgtB/PvdO family nonheme iron enzyme n=1 Tax=Streptomyces decoyicus TaxID=249567 RepID=A0ABZ1FQK7_9ACTN|nr:SUMF1/EgtB/PvdO family nonheme iron enzyme [Streptomyces decoyicus]WSB72190.1 SUMF1/EgtB/PvdO family nonheme iron enzyme [Streptomyces decoyicus]
MAGALSDPSRSRAVLIGTDAYTELDDIPAVANNIGRLRELLGDPAVWGLADERCSVLRQPSRQTVLDTVFDAAAEATDTMVLYYAGHGLVHPQSGELHLALPGSHPDRPHTALRYEELRSILLSPAGGRPSARRKVVVLDCCWSGLALGGLMHGGDLVPGVAVEGAFVLTATAATRQALAPPGETYTAFTGELIRLLDTGVPGRPALLSMSALFEELTAALVAKSRPLPQQSNRNSAGQICLFRNRAGEAGAGTDAPSSGGGGPPEAAEPRAAERRAGAPACRTAPSPPVELPEEEAPSWPELATVALTETTTVRLGRYPVTHAQFRAFLVDPDNAHWRPEAARAAGTHVDDNYLRGWHGLDFPVGRGGHPVVAVSFPAARAYTAWAGRRLGAALRLPTVTEWALAARAGRAGEWWREDIAAGRVNFRGSHAALAPVGEFPPNPYNIGDLLGNVWDICVDDTGAPVLRGGAYDTPAARLREELSPRSPVECRGNVGFRCAGDR